jgi:hypothetical protein
MASSPARTMPASRARGTYITFLNQDDCWFPDRLRAAIDWLEACGADAVIARSATVVPSSHQDEWHTFLTGAGHAGQLCGGAGGQQIEIIEPAGCGRAKG